MFRQNYEPPVSLLEHLDNRLQLLLDDLLGSVRFALLEGFTDAKDNREACVNRSPSLVCDELRRLVEERATLRVACGACEYKRERVVG